MRFPDRDQTSGDGVQIVAENSIYIVSIYSGGLVFRQGSFDSGSAGAPASPGLADFRTDLHGRQATLQCQATHGGSIPNGCRSKSQHISWTSNTMPAKDRSTALRDSTTDPKLTFGKQWLLANSDTKAPSSRPKNKPSIIGCVRSKFTFKTSC